MAKVAEFLFFVFLALFISTVMRLTDGKGVEQGWVRPHVDRAFLFEQAGEAHAYIEA